MLVSRSAENLVAAAASLEGLRGDVAWTVGHVGRSEQADAAVAATIERFGAVDVLVNNAGTNPYMGPLVGIDDARLQKTYEINQASVVTWSRAAWAQWMNAHGGNILNIASIGGLGPEPQIGWYNVTKAAVIHLTRQLAYELAPTVRVNGIAPGLVRTELARGLWEKHEELVAARIPLRRIGEVTDIAPMALLLVSDAGSWITGQVVVVDGGTTTQPSGGVG
jgi:NAD(P)-dependent dehydrogenase (short-subunit alcohol dehydrogenase family)